MCISTVFQNSVTYMGGKLMLISSVFLGVHTQNKDFQTPLALGNTMLPSVSIFYEAIYGIFYIL